MNRIRKRSFKWIVDLCMILVLLCLYLQGVFEKKAVAALTGHVGLENVCKNRS